jgi:hypothetical protein
VNEEEEFDNPDSTCTIDRNILFQYPWKLQEDSIVMAQAVAINRFGASQPVPAESRGSARVTMGRPTEVVY